MTPRERLSETGASEPSEKKMHGMTRRLKMLASFAQLKRG